MGVDKATLSIGGEPLWQRQLRVLSALQPQVLWLSARCRPSWCPPDILTLLDEPPFCGPLSGLAPALSQIATSHLLALAVDLPFMQTEHLGALWALAREGCGVVPIRDAGFEPLCAIYPRAAASEARKQLASGQGSLQQLVRRLAEQDLVQPYHVPASGASLYHNMNAPAQVPRNPLIDS
jgi:molybdopterin-guanine dinucleotide biosynthesis protein A